MYFDLTDLGTVAAIIVIGLIAIGLIMARLYRRASKETSFVRTGFGGQKVIVNGGAIVLPVLHEIIPVNMNTLRLEVKRANDQALITRDRMRVDVLAEFYVRVQPTVESIANAAQTLGMRTMEPEALKELVEGKFVDALRAVAAEMAMYELHEQRVDFVQKVQQVVSEDLLKNGLELESVSLTGLDQTGKQYFNPDNAFDAEGLTKLTEAIEERRKRRNEIEQETEVSIATKNLEAEKQRLEITRDQEYARLQQSREVEIRKATIEAEIMREQAENKRSAEQAQIVAEQQTEQSRISSEQAVEEGRITMARLLKEKDIEKSKAIESAEIDKRRTLELSEQDKSIAIAQKSREQSVAEAEASRARSEAVKADEQVITVRETEIAERDKQIELVEAAKEAERNAISIKVGAQAEKDAAEDHAEAVRIQAHADADKQLINAEAQNKSEKLAAEAAEIRNRVDAEGKRALNEAENLLAAEQIARQIKLAIIERLPDIIRESVKPMEQIDGIKIYQIDGLNGAGSGSSASEGGESQPSSLADQMVSSVLRYKAQAPLVDGLLEEIGLKGDSLNGLTSGLADKRAD
ncbi:flotillin domain-containing protein [uncultured Amphritea sp.]|uniref:flotillin family protein n=1 Tax=uncultured Amphritea sp. TaxID=981605 RepID=UPI00260556E9|nr:flotillin domain-containing protein [uncultured Amphritea sp.]